MTVEADIFSVLERLVGGRAFPDTAPANTEAPFIVYQQVGGTPLNYLAGVPDKKNGRFQVNVWATTRKEAAALIRKAEDDLRLHPSLFAQTLNGALSQHDQEVGLYGASQDFSIWFTE
jgi:hypothetical protein